MSERALSEATRRRIPLVFRPEDREGAADALRRTDFGMTTWDDYQLDRLRFAVLKMSGGDLAALRHWIGIAEGGDQLDWRDVLCRADFGGRVDAHAAWLADGSNEWPGADPV